MTVIVGLPSSNCVILGADSEATGAITKGTVQKIATIAGADWKCLVGGAGDGDFINLATQDAQRRLTQDAYSLEDLRTTLESVVRDIYVQRLDTLPPHLQGGSDFVLVAAVWSRGAGVRMLKVGRSAALWLDRPIAIGSGSYLANYLLTTFYVTGAIRRHYARLAAYIIAQVKAHAPYCGGPTHVVSMTDEGEVEEASDFIINADETSCGIVMSASGRLLRFVDPVGWGWDLAEIDKVIDGAATQMKADIQTKFSSFAGMVSKIKEMIAKNASTPEGNAAPASTSTPGSQDK